MGKKFKTSSLTVLVCSCRSCENTVNFFTTVLLASRKLINLPPALFIISQVYPCKGPGKECGKSEFLFTATNHSLFTIWKAPENYRWKIWSNMNLKGKKKRKRTGTSKSCKGTPLSRQRAAVSWIPSMKKPNDLFCRKWQWRIKMKSGQIIYMRWESIWW